MKPQKTVVLEELGGRKFACRFAGDLPEVEAVFECLALSPLADAVSFNKRAAPEFWQNSNVWGGEQKN